MLLARLRLDAEARAAAPAGDDEVARVRARELARDVARDAVDHRGLVEVEQGLGLVGDRPGVGREDLAQQRVVEGLVAAPVRAAAAPGAAAAAALARRRRRGGAALLLARLVAQAEELELRDVAALGVAHAAHHPLAVELVARAGRRVELHAERLARGDARAHLPQELRLPRVRRLRGEGVDEAVGRDEAVLPEGAARVLEPQLAGAELPPPARHVAAVRAARRPAHRRRGEGHDGGHRGRARRSRASARAPSPAGRF